MWKWLWTSLGALAIAVAGSLAYANLHSQGAKPEQVGSAPFVCPLTGEELPCPNCCPLKQPR